MVKEKWSRETERLAREAGMRFSRGNVAVQRSGAFLTPPLTLDTAHPEVMKLFLTTRTEVQNSFIRETERTRRTALWLAAALLALACLIPVFAPAGRETVSWWVSAALFLFATGAAGYGVVHIKARERELIASSESMSPKAATPDS